MLTAHPRRPFECTYHFISVGPQAFIMLDVIRSPLGNSLRFFVVQEGQLQHQAVIDEAHGEGAWLAPSGDHIQRRAEALQFDIAFAVQQSACSVAPLNPARVFAITAKDHPHVIYNGTIGYQTTSGDKHEWTLKDAEGTISQHYGRKLPEYLYFNTYFDKALPQLVGAISRVDTALGFRITSGYVSIAQRGQSPRTVLTLRPVWQVQPDGRIKVRSRIGDVMIDLGGQKLEHQIDHQPGITWFNAHMFLPGNRAAPLQGLVETRGPGWHQA